MEPALNKFKHDAMMPLFDRKMDKLIDGIDWSEKDWGFERIESSLKTMTQYSSGGLYSEHVIPEYTPVSDQYSMGACGPNAVVDMFEILDGLDGTDKVEQMSRLWLYWLARYLVGATDEDEGSYLRANLHQCNKVGMLLESDFPYVETNLYPEHIDTDLYTMASNNRIEGFYRLTSEGKQLADEIELSVRTNHPVVFGTGVSEEFTKFRGGDQTWGPPSLLKGFHAMLVVGVRYVYGRREFLLRNSWGKHWGNNGHVWVSEDYITWKKSSDFWVGTKMLSWN